MEAKEPRQGSIQNDPDKPKKKQSFSVRLSERSVDSEQENSIHDADEELSGMDGMAEYSEDDYDGLSESPTSRLTRVSDATRVSCPLAEDFFSVKMSLSFTQFDESEDTIEDIETYKQPRLTKEEDFFLKLGTVPDLSQISVDKLPLTATAKHAPSVASSLQGYFVDPLTGKSICSYQDQDEANENLESLEEEATVDADDHASLEDVDFGEYSFEEFDNRFPMPVQEIAERHVDEDLTVLFEAQNRESHTTVAIKPETQAIDFTAREQTEKFLDDLVNLVARYCELERSTEMVRKNLDKCALFGELTRLFPERDIEEKVNYFLNRKCVEYHRRKHNMRHLQEEKPEKAAQDQAYYKERIEYLDHILGKELAMMKKNNEQIDILRWKADGEEEKTRQEFADFENLVKRTFKCGSRPSLEKFIDTQLGYMSSLRDEISSTRSVIIQRQHTLATLQARLHELENIGNGLRLADYENLQRDFQALGKKIEDRNRELVKMHARFQHNLHSMAHIKLKSDVTMVNISEQLKDLKELELEEYLTRQRLFRMNLIHKKTRQHLNDLSLQCGLLDKPALLRDYDETMERLLKQREIVEDLRKSQSEWEAKLDQLQPNGVGVKSSASTKTVAKSPKRKSAPVSTANINFGVQGIPLNV